MNQQTTTNEPTDNLLDTDLEQLKEDVLDIEVRTEPVLTDDEESISHWKTKTIRELSIDVFIGTREYIAGETVLISAENANSDLVADYWGEFKHAMYVHEDIRELAQEHGGYVEWMNAGLIGIVQ